MRARCRAWRALLAALVIGGVSASAGALGPWRATPENTPGWKVMTPAERIEYQRRMRALESLADCRAFQAEHRARVLERERERDSARERARDRERDRERDGTKERAPEAERPRDAASAPASAREREREQTRLRLRGQPVPDAEALCQQLLRPDAPR